MNLLTAARTHLHCAPGGDVCQRLRSRKVSRIKRYEIKRLHVARRDRVKRAKRVVFVRFTKVAQ